jgi:hypothetical protein
MPVRVWLVLATVTIVRIGAGMQTQSVGAVGPSLVEGMGLAYVASGRTRSLGSPLRCPAAG